MTNRRLSRFALVLCMLASGMFCAPIAGRAQGVWAPTPVKQQNGDLLKLPFGGGIARRSRLWLSVDTRWTQNYGYRPIEVTVMSPNPATRDRTITIRLHAGWRGQVDVEQEFVLPRGSTMAKTTLAVPQYQMWNPFYWWEVWVDGSKDKDLSLKKHVAYSVMQGGYTSGSGRSFLVMTSKNNDRSVVAPSANEFEVLALSAAEFPSRWIDYTCLDVVALSIKELNQLVSLNPAAFDALRHWTAAGGQLWVNDVGQQLEDLAELSKLLQLSESIDPKIAAGNGEADGKAAKQSSIQTGWQPVDFSKLPEGAVTFRDTRTGEIRTARTPEELEQLKNDPAFSSMNEFTTTEDWPIASMSGDSREWYVQQQLGLGAVRAFRGTNDVSLFQQARPTTNLNTVEEEGSEAKLPESLSAAFHTLPKWTVRHGLTPDDANMDFANLLVPGVGEAPVNEFRVLITLFVIVIGPVNYLLLKRWRRLHLMVLTVPLAAVLITAALFAYAIVSDGFGTKARARSVTRLDQRTGETVCWNWVSYYSGLAPKRLVMPADVAMYPIIPGWSRGSVDANVGTKRSLVWTKDQAFLGGGWLRSRIPTQYLTIRARKSARGLELATPPGKLRVTNKLGADVKYLVVIDEAEKVWVGENLAPDGVVFLQPTERAEAAKGLRKLAAENPPEPPAALGGSDSYYRQYEMYRGQYGQYYVEQTLATNLASDVITEAIGIAGNEGLALPPRSYVAVTATAPEVEFGMSGVEEEASFHVIVGEW